MFLKIVKKIYASISDLDLHAHFLWSWRNFYSDPHAWFSSLTKSLKKISIKKILNSKKKSEWENWNASSETGVYYVFFQNMLF